MIQNHEQLEALIHSATFGKQVESFLTSDIGLYLLARANRVYNTAIEDFKKADPTDMRSIMSIQSDMWKAESFRGWLALGVQEGLTSLKILEGEEDDPE